MRLPELDPVFDKYVVYSDVHGQSETLERVLNQYWYAGHLLAGDIENKKNIAQAPGSTRESFELVHQHRSQTILLLGNHGLAMFAGMRESDPDKREQYASFFIRRYQSDIFGSYDIYPNDYSTSAEVMGALEQAMQAQNHLDTYDPYRMYFEGPGFIAVHAGLKPDQDWSQQRKDLDDFATQMQAGHFPAYHDFPDQITSFALASDASSRAPSDISDVVVLSGHAHQLVPPQDRQEKGVLYSPHRIVNGGLRVRLASQLAKPNNEPLYVWRSWDQKIEEIPQTNRSTILVP